MSANNEQAATPTLCKMDCGFFGSEATGGCCSKCWMASIKNKPTTPAVPSTTTSECIKTTKTMKESTRVDTVTTPSEDKATTPTVVAPIKKKKKKKAGYKNMMASMMAGSEKKDFAKEKEILAQGLGGGAFSKIEKI